jgi:hypothetical protein
MPEKVVETLADRAPLAIVVIGVFVFIVGAVGGLPVGNPPLQITDPAWRVGLGALGIILAAVGLLLQFRETTTKGAGTRSEDRVHRYSGTWIVQNSFSRWRGRTILPPDKVSFDGRVLLLLPFDGQGGGGVQIGRLQVRVADYCATYEIVNEVQSASVDKDEALKMQVRVIRRRLTEEEPPPPADPGVKDPYADLRAPLKNSDFVLTLSPVAGSTPLRLDGSHTYEDALSTEQAAAEKYVYGGLFGPPGL